MSGRFLVLLALALLFGAAITWIDTRPTWDDTGITAGLLLITSAILGAVMPSRAWVWALAVGVWIPVLGFLHGNPATLLGLIVTFLGAYAGALLRSFSKRTT